MKKYANYHKHDHISNIFVPDTHIKCEDYLKRIKELDYDCYWTTNHGTGGDIFEARDLCDQYGIKCYYGLEGYIVKDPYEKDNRNYHIVVIPKTNMARKKLNLATSRASEEGFYYKPRLFLEDLLKFEKNELYFTTACVAGIIRDDDGVNDIFEPLVNHFGDNVFLEVQNHNENNQKRVVAKCVELSKKYGLRLIAANDSHYIYPEQSIDRLEFLKGKGINYGDEDSYVLDYPDYDTSVFRFKKQGILTEGQIFEALDNTRIFEECEEIQLDKNIKMPSAYPNMSADEKIQELKSHINEKFSVIKREENIIGDKLKMYLDGIKYEMGIIEDTKELNTADYFLLNEKIVDLAVNKYGGILTRTGRGSCGSFYINRVLGMTQIDRFTSPIKLYPERFISTARLLENHAMPDIDYNVASQEPFINAGKEVLGEHCVYPMVAYGTMQIAEAFRNVCRSHGLNFDDFNEIAKNVEKYENDSKWKDYVDEAKKYVDVVISASVHPCAFALSNNDLRYEYGIVKVGKALCVMITSAEADYWKILKDDFLIVSVWGIISDTFKLIGEPVLTVNQLFQKLDDKVWKIYADGITCTLNQVDSDYATNLMRRYKAKSVGEMAMFTAAVRPSFDPWRDDFIERKHYTTGSKMLDEVLSETEGRITFQETLMTYFQWLGVTPAESIGLIKKISKKKIKPEDFEKLEERLKDNWLKNTGSMEHFDETWHMVQSCMSYGFAAPHALATAIDSVYGAYLKANYPMEYYITVFKYYTGDLERTKKLTDELSYFKIRLRNAKFRKSKSDYTIDRENNVIYKGMESIKYCNAVIADELYELRNNQYDYFMDLLIDIDKKTTVDARQLDILIRLDFFSEFGNSRMLDYCVGFFRKFKEGNAKQMSKAILVNDNTLEEIVKRNSRATEKTYLDLNTVQILHECEEQTQIREPVDYPIGKKIEWQQEYLGYTNIQTGKPEDKLKLVVLGIRYLMTKDKSKCWAAELELMSVGTGIKNKLMVFKRTLDKTPLKVYNIITVEYKDMKLEKRGQYSNWYLNKYNLVE